MMRSTARGIVVEEMKEPEFPELTKLRAFDRQQHIQKAIEMGMTREQAERHADEDIGDRTDAHADAHE